MMMTIMREGPGGDTVNCFLLEWNILVDNCRNQEEKSQGVQVSEKVSAVFTHSSQLTFGVVEGQCMQR